MKDICEKLTTFYNTNILDIVPDISKEFLKVSIENRNSGRGKKVLMDLIYNHNHKQKPQAKFIGGPRILTMHWSEKYKKMIYIFGEHHSKYMDCWLFPSYNNEKITPTIPIEKYLWDLILTTDVFIDIFFEFPIYKGKEYHSRFYPFPPGKRFEKLFLRFKDCVQYATRAADECKLARIHYFDARFKDDNGHLLKTNDICWYISIVIQVTSMFDRSEWSKYFTYSFYDDSTINKLNGILNALAEPDDEKCLSFFMSQIFNNPLIIKELDKIKEDLSLKDRILDFIKEQLKEQIKQERIVWQKNSKILLNRANHSDSEVADAIESIKLYYISALIADVYLLARMFKDFKMDDIEEKGYKGATDQPDRATNIIVYAGDGHSIIYRKFLESIGFKEYGRSGKSKLTHSEPQFCVNMDIGTIKQPFFSEWPPTKK
jgi:hypothetical protein